jgi:hypothetical protein
VERRRRRIVFGVVGLVALAALVALTELAFRAVFDTDYFRWYLANGALIAVVFGLLTLAWGDLLNKQTYLISAHPVEYAAASVSLLVFPFAALGAALQTRRRPRPELVAEMRKTPDAVRSNLEELLTSTHASESLRAEILGRFPAREPAEAEVDEDLPTGVPVVDMFLAIVFALAFAAAVATWLLVIVPLQYFVYLVTGAPAREACGSATRAVFFREGNELVTQETFKDADLPEGAVESGFSVRPVSFTAAITAAVLFAVSQLVG